ncbi:hypothetical protein VP1G_11160 [Cytospora mali]|uniref:Uncharacterized protein n=1 Tax=Cytospora mali TaxID=578113 RepID=A0A194V9Z0_CYTMA|nr:hypothetical protein VP1G_11160 [Valsa mali var. pyri (nom. inval.)]
MSHTTEYWGSSNGDGVNHYAAFRRRNGETVLYYLAALKEPRGRSADDQEAAMPDRREVGSRSHCARRDLAKMER